MSSNKCVIHDFNVYEDDFHDHENQIKIKSVGWNGREIDIIPMYELMKKEIVPNGDLMKLKVFDIVRFEENRAYDSYLIVPLKVKNKFEVNLGDIDIFLKNFLLSYGLIPFEFDCSGENSCIPPEGIEAIENNDIHYFDIIKNMEDVNGIIVDHMYLKNNFILESISIEVIGESFDYDQIPFIWITNKYKFTLNDATDEQIDSMKGCRIIVPKMDKKEQMNNVQLIYAVIKDLPTTRNDPYPYSFNLSENNIIIETNDNKPKELKKSKTPNLQSKKKDELIRIVQEKDSKIDELETNIFHLTNDLNKITEQYKVIKEKNNDNERDSKYLNHNVSKGMDNMRQYLKKIEIEMNKIKPEFC